MANRNCDLDLRRQLAEVVVTNHYWPKYKGKARNPYRDQMDS